MDIQISQNNENLSEALIHAGYKPLYQYHNTREKYQCNQFIIDFDKAVWKEHTFEICEIKVLVERDRDVSNAFDQIKRFAEENNIKMEPIEARLIEIIKIQNPDHYFKLTRICP